MKKIILFFALLLSVGSVNAKEDKVACNVTFPDSKSENCTYDTSTDVFAWTQSYSNAMRIFKDVKGNIDLSTYKYLNVNPTNLSGSYRIIIYCDNNGSSNSFVETYSGAIKLDLTSITLTTTGHTYKNINNINIAGSGNSGNLTITEDDVYLSTDEYEAMTITTTLDKNSTATSPFEWKTDGTDDITVINDFDGSQSKGYYFGYNSNNNLEHGYFDLTGYDKVKATLSSFDSEKSAQMRLIAGAGTTNTINFESGTLVYEQALTTTKCATIRAAQGANNHQVMSTIKFTKEFDEISTTAFNIAASASSSVAYNRTFTVDQKSTVCLPFALTASEVTAAGKFYKLTSVVGGVLHFTEQSTTEAYVPYVFVPTATNPFASLTGKAIVATPATYATTIDGYTFQGTMAHQTLESGVYGYDSSTGDFSVTTSTAVTIDAFRAYIKSTTTGAHSLDCIFEEGGITGISEVKSMTEVNNGKYYNLNGQEVENPTKGLYIVNGKKVILK